MRIHIAPLTLVRAGQEMAENKAAGECPKGGKHVFKFTKCVKCGQDEMAARRGS